MIVLKIIFVAVLCIPIFYLTSYLATSLINETTKKKKATRNSIVKIRRTGPMNRQS